MQAANFIHALQVRQGLQVACVEEVAYHMGFLSADQVRARAEAMRGNPYGAYLLKMLDDEKVS